MRDQHRENSLIEKIRKQAESRYPDWWHGGEVEQFAYHEGYKQSNASRRCRELVEEGWLEVRYNHKGHAEYRFIPNKVQTVTQNQDGTVSIDYKSPTSSSVV